MDLDDFLEKVGSFGKAQALVFTVPSILSILCAFHTFAPVYLFYSPLHRCHLPSSSAFANNDTFAIQNEQHRHELLQYLPTVSAVNSSSSISSSSSFSSCSKFGNYSKNSSVACNEWVFDQIEFTQSFVTKAALVCSNRGLTTLLTTSTFAGFLVGVLVSGFVSDFLGRRIGLLIFTSISAASSLASVFAASAVAMAIGRFFIGFGFIGAFTVSFVISTEIVGPSARVHTGLAIEYFWTGGAVMLAGIAYLTRHWQWLQASISSPIIPLLLAAAFPCVVPESPRWLLAKGRRTEAKAILQWMARVNNVPHCSELVEEVCDTCEAKAEQQAAASEGKEGFYSVAKLLLFQAPQLLVQFAVICCNWFVISLVYYGLSMGAKNLPGSIFFTSTLNALVELPAYLLGHATVDRFGRKMMHIGCIGCAGLALLALLLVFLVAKEISWLILTLSMLGKLFTTAAFGIMYLWTAEMHPTEIRNIGLSICSMFARVGTLFAPVLADIRTYITGDTGTALAYAIFASVTLSAAAMSMLLPETRGSKLPESLRAMVQVRGGTICCRQSTSDRADKTNKIHADTRL